MSERVTEPLRPFPVDSVGRLAITSLTLPTMRPEEWRVLDGSSFGMTPAEAVRYSDYKSDDPGHTVSNIVKKFWGGLPFAIRVGIELGQLIQPRGPKPTPELPIAQRRVFYLESRGLSVGRLSRLGRPGFSPSSLYQHRRDLCDNLGAANISHAIRLGFGLGLFPPVDVAEAQARYRNLQIAKRMRGFLRLVYPDYVSDENDDREILGAVSKLDAAAASLWLKVEPLGLFELPQRLERLKQWLNGASINDISKKHRLKVRKVQYERRALVDAFRRFVPIETLIDRSET